MTGTIQSFQEKFDMLSGAIYDEGGVSPIIAKDQDVHAAVRGLCTADHILPDLGSFANLPVPG